MLYVKSLNEHEDSGCRERQKGFKNYSTEQAEVETTTLSPQQV